MQTSHPHVYAAGDITGFSQLAHTAYREGEVAVNHILGNEERMDYRAIPAVVYTNPEVAGVGKTEEELKASGEYYNLVKIPMTYSGRFVAENETGNGLCKLLTNVNGQIIGCHLVGIRHRRSSSLPVSPSSTVIRSMNSRNRISPSDCRRGDT